VIRGAALTRIRGAVYGALTDTVVISRRVIASDGAGGSTAGWARVWSGPGHLTPVATIASAEATIGDRESSARAWVCALPYGTGITLADRIVSGGRTFEVTSTDCGRTLGFSTRVQCVEAA